MAYPCRLDRTEPAGCPADQMGVSVAGDRVVRLLRAIVALVGVAGSGHGAVGLIGHQPIGNLFSQAIFAAAVVVTHDAILVPAAVAIGVATVRWTPAWPRWPGPSGPVHHRGPDRGRPPVHHRCRPRRRQSLSASASAYAHGLLIAAAVVWTAAGAVAGWRWFVRADRRTRSGSNNAT